MFHYINWRPTSVIRKHCLPSEADFFKTKMVTSPPPDKQKADAWETYLSASKIGIKSHRSASRKEPPRPITVLNLQAEREMRHHEKPTSALARKALKVINQHQEKPRKTIFWSQTSPKTRRSFFNGSRRQPFKKAWLFLVADVTKRWLPEVPDVKFFCDKKSQKKTGKMSPNELLWLIYERNGHENLHVALSKEIQANCTKKRYSVFASEKFKNFFLDLSQKIYMTVKLEVE